MNEKKAKAFRKQARELSVGLPYREARAAAPGRYIKQGVNKDGVPVGYKNPDQQVLTDQCERGIYRLLKAGKKIGGVI